MIVSFEAFKPFDLISEIKSSESKSKGLPTSADWSSLPASISNQNQQSINLTGESCASRSVSVFAEMVGMEGFLLSKGETVTSLGSVWSVARATVPSLPSSLSVTSFRSVEYYLCGLLQILTSLKK